MAEARLSQPTVSYNIRWAQQVYQILGSNPLLVGTITATPTEINYLAGVTLGTVTASKALTVDSSKNISTINQMTATTAVLTSLTQQGETINPVIKVEQTAAYTDLSAAASKTIKASTGTKQYKVRAIRLSGAGTNFAAGDRNLSIQSADGTVTYSVIPAATLLALAAGDWGSIGVPFPSTASHLLTATPAGNDLVAKYSGGTTDYTSGSLTLYLELEKTA